MKRFNVYLEGHDWLLRVYIGVDPVHYIAVINDLYDFGCDRDYMSRAELNIKTGHLDTGLTYSNKRERQSLIAINRASSAEEFLNSIVHEITHLAIHIADTEGIDPHSEELCYISGDIAQSIFPHCEQFLCCQCDH